MFIGIVPEPIWRTTSTWHQPNWLRQPCPTSENETPWMTFQFVCGQTKQSPAFCSYFARDSLHPNCAFKQTIFPRMCFWEEQLSLRVLSSAIWCLSGVWELCATTIHRHSKMPSFFNANDVCKVEETCHFPTPNVSQFPKVMLLCLECMFHQQQNESQSTARHRRKIWQTWNSAMHIRRNSANINNQYQCRHRNEWLIGRGVLGRPRCTVIIVASGICIHCGVLSTELTREQSETWKGSLEKMEVFGFSS